MNMKLALSIVAAVALFGQTAQAQQDRAAVKAEAAAAAKSGTLPKGEVAGKSAPAAKSDKPRAEVKAEAAAAEKAGTLPKGDAQAKTAPAAKSDKSRAEVKAETKAAAKKGELAPAGDTQAPPKK